jgi:hypothetical protein
MDQKQEALAQVILSLMDKPDHTYARDYAYAYARAYAHANAHAHARARARAYANAIDYAHTYAPFTEDQQTQIDHTYALIYE